MTNYEIKSKREHYLRQSIEKTLEILVKIDPLSDIDQFKVFQKQFINYSTKYIRRYENYYSESLKENKYRTNSQE